MAEAHRVSAGVGDQRRFLTFRADGRLYALPAEEVAEVIRTPAVARLPQSPPSLLGLANLRGVVLPVASVRRLLGRADADTDRGRAIVLDGAAPVALTVDLIEGLMEVGGGLITSEAAELGAEDGEMLLGAFRSRSGEVAKLLDVRGLLQGAFVQRERPERAARRADNAVGAAEEVEEAERLLTFEVAGQEIALSLDAVHEIIPTPPEFAAVPKAEAVVIGVTAYRATLLPLLSLRGLLGLSGMENPEQSKVVITAVRGALVGLVADRMLAIVAADPTLIEPTPPMLAARIAGEARVKAIYRGDGGRRLISILDPRQLFREDVMQRLDGAGAASAGPLGAGNDAEAEEQQFLIFRLGDEEFAMPIGAVDEVARVPEKITRVPKAPKFLEGVVNLRGAVLPVVDQRRRFDMPALEHSDGQRLIVLRSEAHRAGVIVDAVSQVLRHPADAIDEAPDLAGEAKRLVSGVINLEDEGRMILLLDPAELLTRAERGLLETFQKQPGSAR